MLDFEGDSVWELKLNGVSHRNLSYTIISNILLNTNIYAIICIAGVHVSQKPQSYSFNAIINNHQISAVLIGRHYLIKHSNYMNDELILQLVTALDGQTFPVDSTTNGIDYYVADIEFGTPVKVYRLIWLFEGEKMEILGVINAYRRKRRKS